MNQTALYSWYVLLQAHDLQLTQYNEKLKSHSTQLYKSLRQIDCTLLYVDRNK